MARIKSTDTIFTLAAQIDNNQLAIATAIKELEIANSKGADMVIFGGDKEDINDMRHHVVVALVELKDALHAQQPRQRGTPHTGMSGVRPVKEKENES